MPSDEIAGHGVHDGGLAFGVDPHRAIPAIARVVQYDGISDASTSLIEHPPADELCADLTASSVRGKDIRENLDWSEEGLVQQAAFRI